MLTLYPTPTFYRIWSFRQIRSFLDDSTILSVASTLVSLHLDLVNSILHDTLLNHTACF